MLIAIVLVVVVAVLSIYYLRGHEHYRMYFGMGVKPLTGVCPTPYCGGDPNDYLPEDANYPFLVSDDKALMQEIELSNSTSADVAALAGYKLEADGLIMSSNDIKEIMNEYATQNPKDAPEIDKAYGLTKSETFTGFPNTGPQRYPTNYARGYHDIHCDNQVLAPNNQPNYHESNDFIDTKTSNGRNDNKVYNAMGNFMNEYKPQFRYKMTDSSNYDSGKTLTEGFDQVSDSRLWSKTGLLTYDHPDTDNWNNMYYSNPSRTLGISNERQAVIHFNEEVAYYGRNQEPVPVSYESTAWYQNPTAQMQASDFFDISGKYSLLTEDPRIPAQGSAYGFKKRRHFDDVLDETNRRRNQTLADQAERGTRVTGKAREIINNVFGPDCERDVDKVWWEKYES